MKDGIVVLSSVISIGIPEAYVHTDGDLSLATLSLKISLTMKQNVRTYINFEVQNSFKASHY
jgi:hypothetical protein